MMVNVPKVYSLNSLSYVDARTATDARVRELYLEFRVAGQYDKCWATVEDRLRLAATLKGVETPGRQGDDQRDSIPASYRWMELFELGQDYPRWFVYDELGIGTDTNIFDTESNLTADNRRRREQWVKAQAAEVRKLVSRTVRG